MRKCNGLYAPRPGHLFTTIKIGFERRVVCPHPNPINHSKWGVVHHMYVHHMYVLHITVHVHVVRLGLVCVCKLVNLTGVFQLHGFSGGNQIVDINH